MALVVTIFFSAKRSRERLWDLQDARDWNQRESCWLGACSCLQLRLPDVVFAHCVARWDKNWLTQVQVCNRVMRLMRAIGMMMLTHSAPMIGSGLRLPSGHYL